MDFLGSNLRYLRGSLSQAEMGKIFGVSDGQISHYEKGVSFPNLEKAFAIADYFGYTLDTLCRQSIVPPPKNGKNTEGGQDLQKHVEKELQEMDVSGVSMAAESPPPKPEKDEIHAMKKKMLEMMMKLEEMTQ